MLIATFSGGWEVGPLKQREVEKVRRRITHSLSASELLQNGSAQMSPRRRSGMATGGAPIGSSWKDAFLFLHASFPASSHLLSSPARRLIFAQVLARQRDVAVTPVV